jgi:hypothetical protein
MKSQSETQYIQQLSELRKNIIDDIKSVQRVQNVTDKPKIVGALGRAVASLQEGLQHITTAQSKFERSASSSEQNNNGETATQRKRQESFA